MTLLILCASASLREAFRFPGAVTGKINVTKEADQDSRQAAKTPRKGES